MCRELEIGEMEMKGKSLVRRDTAIVEDVAHDNKKVQVNVNYLEKKLILRLNKFDNRFFSNRKILTDSIEP